MQVVYFLILIGVLIFIHEFGHFFFAKLFKVRVERFAMGMGPVIPFLHFKRGETEYTVCLFPIGGYVKMWGMQPEELYTESGERLPDSLTQHAFVRKPLWQRAIIVLAGPAMNLIFPVFVYFFFALGVSSLPPATIGQVLPEGAAATAQPITQGIPQGLKPGDTITAIDGDPITYFSQITDHVRDAAGEPLRVEVNRDGQALAFTITPHARTRRDALGVMKEEFGFMGIGAGSFGPVIGVSDPQSPAAQAGLRSQDRVVSINGRPTRSYFDIEAAIAHSDGKPLTFAVARPQPVDFLTGGMEIGAPLRLTAQPLPAEGGGWTLGLRSGALFVAAVDPQSPAAEAGILPGDHILGLEGRDYDIGATLQEDIQQAFWKEMAAQPDTPKTDLRVPFKLRVERAGEVRTVEFLPRIRMIKGPFNEPAPELWIGFHTPRAVHFPDNLPVPFGTRLQMAVKQGPQEAWRRMRMMVLGIVSLFQGKVSTDTIGGPIMIFDLANRAGKAGWEPFIDMMALISINLGLVNLLPIPVLDGGHLMLFTLEAIKRRELNQRTRQIAYYVGLGLIVLLMLLAFKNDITRYWQDFADWFNA